VVVEAEAQVQVHKAPMEQQTLAVVVEVVMAVQELME